MEKKYQVFISSTYEDLKEERKRIIDVLLQSNCIPAGMELFSATDGAQMETIKSVIDLCDYYILILGERYGSISEETGKSYTEMEYDYALSKGIPVLVFAKKIDVNNIESNEDYLYKDKLIKFRKEALKNRLGVIWLNLSDLVIQVVTSINQAFKQMPRVGWVRLEENITDLPDKIIKLEEENRILQEKCQSLENKISMQNNVNQDDLAFEGSPYTLHYTSIGLGDYIIDSSVNLTLDQIFNRISINMNKYITYEELSNLLVKCFYTNRNEATSILSPSLYFKVIDEDVIQLKNQYIQLGLFEENYVNDNEIKIRLTAKGLELRSRLNLIYKETKGIENENTNDQ